MNINAQPLLIVRVLGNNFRLPLEKEDDFLSHRNGMDGGLKYITYRLVRTRCHRAGEQCLGP